MDLRALHAFRMIAETGSITAAAARLGTVQSALSARIGQFEASIGETLFERLPRGIRLTAAGVRLLPYAERMERLTAEAMTAVRGRQPDLSGPFRLGAIEVAAASVLPATLSSFLGSHPEVDLHLRTEVSRELAASLDAGELDAAIIAEDVGRHGLASLSLDHMPLALFQPADRAPETLEQAFAFGKGCVCRDRLEALVHRRRWNMRIVELGSVDAIFGCVAAGLGVAVLPRMLGAGRVLESKPAGHLDLFLIYRPEADAKARALAASYTPIEHSV
ncbi:LysR family transcriptional regulator [Agrobacterium rhizogenes]|nr:LysR family transcriptional regulator [Rhizobium rhizogenes]